MARFLVDPEREVEEGECWGQGRMGAGDEGEPAAMTVPAHRR